MNSPNRMHIHIIYGQETVVVSAFYPSLYKIDVRFCRKSYISTFLYVFLNAFHFNINATLLCFKISYFLVFFILYGSNSLIKPNIAISLNII